MSSQNKKRTVFVVLGIAVAVFSIVMLLRSEKQAPGQSAKEADGVSSDLSDESVAASATKTRNQKMEQFRKMKEILAQQVVKADSVGPKDTAAPQPAPDETGQLRPSTVFERRTTRELIVLDGIFGMMKNGETDKALMMLDQQRALFPEDNPIESEAFKIISDCIKAKNEITRKAAADFIGTHPDFRLNRQINRLCIEQ